MQAMTAALRTRKQSTAAMWESLCPYDLAAAMELEVQFQAINSLEAVYVDNVEPPLLLVGSLRPNGRQRYSAAHEIGHHVFGHGTTLHELRTDGARRPKDPKEFLADVFASFLLMPKLAVSKALVSRGLKVETITAEALYGLACYFGVGYTTIILHMEANLRFLTEARATALSQATPKQLRAVLAGDEQASELLVVDQQWVGRPADLSVNDLIVLPDGTRIEGDALTVIREEEGSITARATTPGIARLSTADEGWALFARVSRTAYAGRSIFRHDPEEP
jgi:Zn-dependent peptidase ImmA (M78 family)